MRNPNKWHVPLGLIQNLKAITKKSWQWSQINHQSQFRELREPFPLLHLFCPPSDPCGWSWSERDKTPPGHNSAGALVDLCGTMDPTVFKPSHWRVRRISSAKQTSKCWQKNPAPFGDSSRTRGIPPNSANEPSPETSPPLPAVVPKASRCSGVRKRTPFRWQIKGRRLPSGDKEIQWYLSCGRCSWEKTVINWCWISPWQVTHPTPWTQWGWAQFRILAQQKERVVGRWECRDLMFWTGCLPLKVKQNRPLRDKPSTLTSRTEAPGVMSSMTPKWFLCVYSCVIQITLDMVPAMVIGWRAGTQMGTWQSERQAACHTLRALRPFRPFRWSWCRFFDEPGGIPQTFFQSPCSSIMYTSWIMNVMNHQLIPNHVVSPIRGMIQELQLN